MNGSRGKITAAALVSLLASFILVLSLSIPSLQTQLIEPVDVAVIDITDVDGTLIYFVGDNETSSTNVPVDVTLKRLDLNGNVPSLIVNVTLNRMNNATFENVTVYWVMVVLSPAEEEKVPLLWDETLNTLTAGNYDMWAFADVISPGTIDTNMADNIRVDGTVSVVICKEDFNADGVVNIYDAIIFSANYGMTGPPGWIVEDVMPDGTVDWFDKLMLERMFSWSLQNMTIPHPNQSWNLTISTPPGQTRNDSVIVFTDYIVYSQYEFSPALKQLSFNITSSVDGFCNVSIPRTSMSGAFIVYLDDMPAPSIITWNATCYFVYFGSAELSHKVRIVSEYANEIIGDINHDGVVNILDAIMLGNHFLEHYP